MVGELIDRPLSSEGVGEHYEGEELLEIDFGPDDGAEGREATEEHLQANQAFLFAGEPFEIESADEDLPTSISPLLLLNAFDLELFFSHHVEPRLR